MISYAREAACFGVAVSACSSRARRRLYFVLSIRIVYVVFGKLHFDGEIMLVSCENVCFGFGGNSLLENICFTLSEGDRVGLIGANGEGKTTLLRLILSELDAESGTLFKKNGIRIGYLQQNGGYDSENTVWDEMRSIFAEDIKAMQDLRLVEGKIALASEGSDEYRALAARYEALNKKIAARDSYQYEIRIKTVLNGMGFSTCYEQKICTMSGGEKTRLKLCRLLLEDPELLILDEPTNHLDIKTLFWLEEYLSTYKGAILTVSHDRYFLDKLVKQIYEIENKKLLVFKGNYTKYKILKAERNAHLLKEYEKQQVERAHLQEYVDKNLVRASTTKSAQSRRHKLEIMELAEKPVEPPTPPRFFFSYQDKPYENVLGMVALKLVAGEKTLLENLNFEMTRGEKCAVVGDNGTGKSTLIKEIVKGKNPAIKLGRFVKIACYDQENANLDPNNTVPSNAFKAVSKLSLAGKSRWLVGSSKIKKFPFSHSNTANASLARSPPDSIRTFLSISSAGSPACAKMLRTRVCSMETCRSQSSASTVFSGFKFAFSWS